VTEHEGFLNQRRFGSLDGLRALSIVAVVWHHTQPAWARESAFGTAGSHGVTLFFAISGFLITTLLLRERVRNGAIDLKAFYIRRTLRIFPLYYTVLLIYTAAVLVLERDTAPGREFIGNLPYFATYTSNFLDNLDAQAFFSFSWSLAAEEQFYLLWPPLLALPILVNRAAWPLLLVLAICIPAQEADLALLSKVPVAIVAGALLAVALHSARGYQVAARLLRYHAMPAVLLAVIIPNLAYWVFPQFVVEVLFAMLVGSCVITERHLLSRLLAFRPIAYLGIISYGMYLFHMLCKNVIVRFLPMIGMDDDGIEVFPLTLGLVVAVAAVSFRYYESYFMNIKKSYET